MKRGNVCWVGEDGRRGLGGVDTWVLVIEEKGAFSPSRVFSVPDSYQTQGKPGIMSCVSRRVGPVQRPRAGRGRQP